MIDVQPLPPGPAFSQEEGLRLSQEAMATALSVGILIYCLAQAVISWARDLERRHHRAQLLAAYRKRHAWKRSDILRLRELGVNKVVERRMERLTGRGRPIVRARQPLDQLVVETVTAFQSLFDPASTSIKRRQAIKLWSWWRHHVEALYRGEHRRARQTGLRSPSVEAEISVGRTLGISAASVHAICGEIRRMRREDPESANFPAMTLSEFEEWMQTGVREFPD